MGIVVDVAAVCLLLAALAAGLRTGLLASLGSVAGMCGGVALSMWAIPQVTGRVEEGLRTPAGLGTLLVLLVLGAAVGSMIGARLEGVGRRRSPGGISRLLGGVIGLVAGVALLLMAGAVLAPGAMGTASGAAAPMPEVAQAIAHSHLLPGIEHLLPAAIGDAAVDLGGRIISQLR